jgi:hypothetical protein
LAIEYDIDKTNEILYLVDGNFVYPKTHWNPIPGQYMSEWHWNNVEFKYYLDEEEIFHWLG